MTFLIETYGQQVQLGTIKLNFPQSSQSKNWTACLLAFILDTVQCVGLQLLGRAQ